MRIDEAKGQIRVQAAGIHVIKVVVDVGETQHTCIHTDFATDAFAKDYSIPSKIAINSP